METVAAGRRLIGDTLGFHLFFVLFGVALPLLICGLEAYSIWKKRPAARQTAHEWSKALVVLFIAGAISGTIVSMQFNLLWPIFTSLAGKVVGLSFALEGFAFLIEALFLTIYMLSWKRFTPLQHWLCSLPIVAGSIGSAFAITTVNAWMNTPRGFRLDGNGNPVDINTRQAVFNPAVGTEVTHSILSYLFATTLVLLAIYAWIAWRHNKGRPGPRLQRLMLGLASLAVIFGILVAFTGDRAGKFLAKNEPAKLAAIEGLQQTQTNAPLLVGGTVSGSEVKHALKVPGLLSFLATGHFNGKVTGLADIKPSDRPPVIVHYFFDGMVAIGTIGILIPGLYLVFRRWRPRIAHRKIMLKGLFVCGFLGVIGAEFGWLVTEFGRQPYVIHGVLRTADAVTQNKAVIGLGETFPLLYLLLLALSIFALRKVFHPAEALHEPS
jgi:cytochrome d ubiquinol oxidase subunit I